MKNIEVDSIYSAPKVKDLGEKCDNTNLIIFYTDDSVENTPDALIFLKDYCAEKNEQVIVIGTKDEYTVVQQYITCDEILNFYERPLDMEKLITEVENYLSEDGRQSRRKNILIVDDDVTYMSMIMDWLKDSYRVSMANSGMQAITWLAKNHADLILLDYEMPITTGPQVLQMIRSDAATADIPVMFLTGKGDKESIMSVLALKPVGYLLKTSDRNKIRESIGNYFTMQKAKK